MYSGNDDNKKTTNLSVISTQKEKSTTKSDSSNRDDLKHLVLYSATATATASSACLLSFYVSFFSKYIYATTSSFNLIFQCEIHVAIVATTSEFRTYCVISKIQRRHKSFLRNNDDNTVSQNGSRPTHLSYF